MASFKEVLREIKILLLGETGVGKSTFINAFANYLNFGELKDAEASEPICLIPTSFVITTKQSKRITIRLGDDSNESKDVTKGQSATQMCRNYEFPINNSIVRFIDTPGMGDTRCLEQDKFNVSNILSFIGAHDVLHAICILLKPNNPRLTTAFEFVITQLLSHLERSACKNIIFVYTNARTTFYSPGDTAPVIEEVLNRIKTIMGVEIAHDMESNVFCLDNEAFRFMLAVREKVPFGEEERKAFAASWETSVKECERLMKYIVGGPNIRGLEPHKVKNTISINEARRMISTLRKPSEEIVENIEMNVDAVEKRKKEIEAHEGDIKDLESKLAIPIIDTITTELEEPQTVCTSEKCREIVQLTSGRNITRFPQKCCYPCFPVSKEPLWGLIRVGQHAFDYLGALYLCQAFDKKGICVKCECSFTEHAHIYYNIEIIEKVDHSMKVQLYETKDVKYQVMEMVNKLEMRLRDYEKEKAKIMETAATFAHFLNANAIIPYSDSFERYIKLQIENEELKPESENKYQIIKRYQNMLDNYKEMKEHWENLVKSGRPNAGNVTTDKIFQLIEELYVLPIYGIKIKEASDIYDRAYNKEVLRGQVVHQTKPFKVLDKLSTSAISHLTCNLSKLFS